MKTSKQILTFLNHHLNDYRTSPLISPMKVIQVTCQTDICEDTSNEELYFALITFTYDNFNPHSFETILDIPGLSLGIQDIDAANGDHSLKLGTPLTMNNSLLLPVILLS